jgi:DNA excision repair protein ERCC-3
VSLLRDFCVLRYDFRRDTATPDLPIQLRPIALIRDYQEKSLSKMFGNGRARSGIIVLPCGAGKSLVGITALTTIKKSTLIFWSVGEPNHASSRRMHARMPRSASSLSHTHRLVFSRFVACSNTGVSVEQWKQQLEKWSNLPPKYIACFTASQKDRVQTDALVLITTYNMVRHTCHQ